MGFMDRVKFALFAGGFGVEVVLEQPVYEDLPVRGRVRLGCGEQPATVTKLTLTYRGGCRREDEQGREYDHFEELDSFSTPLEGTLQPGQLVEVPFERALDLNHGYSPSYEWIELKAEVDVPGAQNPQGRAPFQPRPAPPLDALHLALCEQLGWGKPTLRVAMVQGRRWMSMAFGEVPAAYKPVIDSVIVCATPVDLQYGHSVLAGPEAHARQPAGGAMPFVARDGRACALALECAIDRDGQGAAGLLKELQGQDKLADRYVARDVESALARVRGFIEHAARLGPVR